jgi:hypothetical protein
VLFLIRSCRPFPFLNAATFACVCGDNTALLTRVRALLEVHEQEQDFLRSAGPEATTTPSPIARSRTAIVRPCLSTI